MQKKKRIASALVVSGLTLLATSCASKTEAEAPGAELDKQTSGKADVSIVPVVKVTRSTMASVMPRAVKWIKGAVATFEPTVPLPDDGPEVADPTSADDPPLIAAANDALTAGPK